MDPEVLLDRFEEWGLRLSEHAIEVIELTWPMAVRRVIMTGLAGVTLSVLMLALASYLYYRVAPRFERKIRDENDGECYNADLLETYNEWLTATAIGYWILGILGTAILVHSTAYVMSYEWQALQLILRQVR